MNRRSFLTLASGLLVPYEPERVYSFATEPVGPFFGVERIIDTERQLAGIRVTPLSLALFNERLKQMYDICGMTTLSMRTRIDFARKNFPLA